MLKLHDGNKYILNIWHLKVGYILKMKNDELNRPDCDGFPLKYIHYTLTNTGIYSIGNIIIRTLKWK